MSPDESLDLFPSERSARGAPAAPLAERMRPRRLDEMIGQPQLLAPGAGLRALMRAGALPSLILWGPPGSGKTTIARLLAEEVGAHFEALSAVTAGVKEIRAVVDRAARQRGHTVLFLDEIHRLNRAQQDTLLPHVERGTVTLIGATTENPSFEVIAPLLSRCRVYVLERLGEEDLAAIVQRAAADPRGLGGRAAIGDAAIAAIAHAADGDARRALGILETAAAIAGDGEIAPEAVREAVGRRTLVHDRDREEHYNLASAFIKSLRASDPDAALYYAARLLAAGDDLLFLARRLVIFASEDVGNADPAALGIATAAYLAAERVGLPEGRIPIAQAITYLACAPKSNAAYRALGRALEAVEQHGSQPVPLHLRNAPTRLMEHLGYGRDYTYPHDASDAFVARNNLPEALGKAIFYEPTRTGAEAAVAERLAAWRQRKEKESGC
ncbi:MAG TPA: replication-associated recombination protein A [Myxococcota bacterium]|nr:replication-associated recombination protein A [Myxococcota bacterium]